MGAPKEPKGGGTPGFRTGFLLLTLFTLATIQFGLGFGNLWNHSSCGDLLQFLADGFREGQLNIRVDGRTHAIVDTAVQGDRIYLTYGPAPAVIYALFDVVWEALTETAFPKMLLFAAAILAHVLALYSLLVRLMGRRVVLPWILSAAYLLSYPYWRFLMDEGFAAGPLSATYASGLFLASVALYCRNAEKPSPRTALASGTLLFLACLTRQIYFLPGAVFGAAILLRRRFERDALVFGFVALSAVGLHLAYNEARFDSPTYFGGQSTLHTHWEQIMLAHNAPPQTIPERMRQMGQAFESWWGVGFGDPDRVLYYTLDQAPVFSAQLNLLLLGLLFGGFVWLRSPRKHAMHTTLLVALFPILFFYHHIWPFSGTRYAIDMYPLLYVLSLAGTWQLSRRAEQRFGARMRPLLPVLVSIWLVLNGLGRTGHDLVHVRPLFHGQDNAPLTSERFEPDAAMALCSSGQSSAYADGEIGRFALAELGAPGESVECVTTDGDPRLLGEPRPWWFHRSLRRIGMYQDGEGCEMLYYSGATLNREADAECTVTLALEPDEAPACDTIELYIDGRARGRLRPAESADESAASVCAGDVPPAPGGQVTLWFWFTETPVAYVSNEIIATATRYGFRSLRLSCATDQP